MTWLIRVALAVVFGTVSSCGRAPVREETRSEKAETADGHAEERNAIHLSDDMVRDLRIGTQTVAERVDEQEVTVLGEVEAPRDRYAEVAPATGGQVVRVLVDVNGAVSRGTPLAELRSPELGNARAALLLAMARRDLATQTLDRKRSLAGERIVPQREVQEAEAASRAAEAEWRAATAAMQALGAGGDADAEDSSLFTVRSPIAGRVVARTAVLGKYADPSGSLFTVADLDRVWVIAHVFERDAVNTQVGGIAHVTLAALPGREFDGPVALIGRQVEPGSRTLPVRIVVTNPRELLRPGMSASVRLPLGGPKQRVIAVPSAALQRVGERWLAFVPKGPAEFEMRPVGRGRELGQDVEVVSGLRAGEQVVVEGAFLLKAEAEKRAGGRDEHGH